MYGVYINGRLYCSVPFSRSPVEIPVPPPKEDFMSLSCGRETRPLMFERILCTFDGTQYNGTATPEQESLLFPVNN